MKNAAARGWEGRRRRSRQIFPLWFRQAVQITLRPALPRSPPGWLRAVYKIPPKERYPKIKEEINSAQTLVVWAIRQNSLHFWRNSGGTLSISSPKKSLICVIKMTTAIPVVKPVVTGKGMNFNSTPIRAMPIKTNKTAAISVAKASPS